jgi:transposase-like protein
VPKGQRREQFLAAVREQPGISVSEIAKQLKLASPNSLYPLANRLQKEKEISKKGSGYIIKRGAA